MVVAPHGVGDVHAGLDGLLRPDAGAYGVGTHVEESRDGSPDGVDLTRYGGHLEADH